jgi:hypothetical protein
MTKNLRLAVLCGLLFVPCLAFARGEERIRIAKVTLQAGMPQRKALQLLSRSHDLSVIEDHTNAYVIKDVRSGVILGSVEFKESKLVSASRNWGRPRPDQLASASFASAVFEALDNLTGRRRLPCTVGTSSANPNATPLFPEDPYHDDQPEDREGSIACGKNGVIISVGASRSGEFSHASIKEVISEGQIRVGKVTLEAGMPREQALPLLKSETDIREAGMPREQALQVLRSVSDIPGVHSHQLPNEAKLLPIVSVEKDVFLWLILLDESKLLNVSRYWLLPGSDKPASAQFTNAVFQALDGLKGPLVERVTPLGLPFYATQVACTVETAVTNPTLGDDSAIASIRSINPNDISSEIRQVNITCGKKQISVSIGTTASRDVSFVDIAESIFAK